MIKYHYTYVIMNLINRMRYIGVRSCSCLPEEDNSYMGSSVYLKSDIIEYRQDSFVKQILGYHTSIGFGFRFV
jgi:hypothetical protein